jgi:hypothetical protein
MTSIASVARKPIPYGGTSSHFAGTLSTVVLSTTPSCCLLSAYLCAALLVLCVLELLV